MYLSIVFHIFKGVQCLDVTDLAIPRGNFYPTEGKQEIKPIFFSKLIPYHHFLPIIFSASGCPLASKNKALREQLSGNVKYSNGSTPSFGNRLAALSSNSYDPEGLSQDKTSPNNDPNDEKVPKMFQEN